MLNRLSDQHRAMLSSFLRVLAAAAVAALLGLGKNVTDLGVADLKVMLDAVLAAAGLTLVNYLRSGETRFGRGADAEL